MSQTRTKKYELREQVARLQRKGADIRIEYAGQPQRPRAFTKSDNRELSPRLGRGDMAVWLDGYETSLDSTSSGAVTSGKQPSEAAIYLLIKDFMQQGNTSYIPCIKLVMTIYGWDLFKAKNFVDKAKSEVIVPRVSQRFNYAVECAKCGEYDVVSENVPTYCVRCNGQQIEVGVKAC